MTARSGHENLWLQTYPAYACQSSWWDRHWSRLTSLCSLYWFPYTQLNTHTHIHIQYNTNLYSMFHSDSHFLCFLNTTCSHHQGIEYTAFAVWNTFSSASCLTSHFKCHFLWVTLLHPSHLVLNSIQCSVCHRHSQFICLNPCLNKKFFEYRNCTPSFATALPHRRHPIH